MTREGVCSTLDGNAAGGLLREVFAFEATAARTICAGCARVAAMAELRLYAVELGAILRCPACDEAVVRIGRTPRGVWLDMRGAAAVVAVSTVVGVSAVFAGDLTQVHHKVQDVGGIRVFYREAGPPDAPTILLLHGFRPHLTCTETSSRALQLVTVSLRRIILATGSARRLPRRNSTTPSTTSQKSWTAL